MDVARLALEFVRALLYAWPTAIVIIVLVFRKPLAELIGRLKSVKGGGVELTTLEAKIELTSVIAAQHASLLAVWTFRDLDDIATKAQQIDPNATTLAEPVRALLARVAELALQSDTTRQALDDLAQQYDRLLRGSDVMLRTIDDDGLLDAESQAEKQIWVVGPTRFTDLDPPFYPVVKGNVAKGRSYVYYLSPNRRHSAGIDTLREKLKKAFPRKDLGAPVWDGGDCGRATGPPTRLHQGAHRVSKPVLVRVGTRIGRPIGRQAGAASALSSQR